jgi:hypothetical protein
MSELEIKYNLLDSVLQKQVLEFIDFLVSTKNIEKPDNLSSYKTKILKTSKWSKKDISQLNDNLKQLNQWKIEEW